MVRKMPRVQKVVLTLLREGMPGVEIVSWGADVDHRVYPYVNVRRLGGISRNPKKLDRPTIELTVYGRGGLVATEDLYLDAREVLWDAVRNQTVTEFGYLHSFKEIMGPTQLDSPWDDTWRVQGLIGLGLRPPRQ